MVRTDLYFDPENEQIVLRCVDENGDVIATLPQVRIKLEDLQYADQVGNSAIEAIFRRVHFANSSDGSPKRCYGLFTIPESDASDDSHSSSTEDLYFGGGGVVMMAVVSYHQDAVHGDYLICQPPDTTEPGDRVEVAIEPKLQSAITTQTAPDGNVWEFTLYGGMPVEAPLAQTRKATCTSGPKSGTVLTEYIAEPFLVDDVIPVQLCGNTGVEVLNVETEEYEPVNLVVLGHHWAAA